MTILCIETSTSVCSAAICKDGEPINQCICKEGSNHARLLPRYLEQLIEEAKHKDLPIDAVALSEGPGSYTGLRIGASTTKGLCYGLNVPLIPVPTLDVLCQALKAHSQWNPQPSDILFPMIDARRMEVYTKEQRNNGQSTKEADVRAVVVESEESLTPAQRDDVQREYYYFGDGAAKCQKVLTLPNWHYVADIVPEAQYMGVLAEAIIAKGQSLTANQIAYYEPFYLKEFIAAPSHVKGLE